MVASQLLEVGRQMRQRVWQAAHVGLKEVTLAARGSNRFLAKLEPRIRRLRADFRGFWNYTTDC
jgi:hypothetical protein